jgi:hypothetical protein
MSSLNVNHIVLVKFMNVMMHIDALPVLTHCHKNMWEYNMMVRQQYGRGGATCMNSTTNLESDMCRHQTKRRYRYWHLVTRYINGGD